MAASKLHLESAKGKAQIARTKLIDARPLISGLRKGQELKTIKVLCKNSEPKASVCGLFTHLANGYAIVRNELTGGARQDFIRRNVTDFIMKHDLTLGPASALFPSGFQIGNLKEGSEEEKNKRIIAAFAEAGMQILAKDITHKTPTAEETWMFVYNMPVADKLTKEHKFSITATIRGGSQLVDFEGAKEALLLMERLIEKKNKGMKIRVHVTDKLGETKVSYHKPLHDSYYKKVHDLETAKEQGRDVAIHGAKDYDRLTLGVADVVLRTAKALTYYFGHGYSEALDKQHIKECEKAIVYMKDYCKSLEVDRSVDATARVLFAGPPGGASAKDATKRGPPGSRGGAPAPRKGTKRFKTQGSGKEQSGKKKRSRKGKGKRNTLNEAFSHLIL